MITLLKNDEKIEIFFFFYKSSIISFFIDAANLT